MKSLAVFALPMLALPFVPAPTAAQSDDLAPPTAPQSNRLGNGGFELWSYGSLPDGPVPPDLWWPMGTTQGLFTQTAIEFTRVPAPVPTGACQSGRGEYVVEVTPTAPGNFVSQLMENPGEFRGERVTFSIDFTTPFGIANPALLVDDGVTSSSADVIVNSGCWKRLTVSHLVDPAATKLELRIQPNETVWADNAQLVLGKAAVAAYVPRANPEPGRMQLPLGTVVDWYRFEVGMPVPEGFAIADGSLVGDPESPLFGLPTPDLRDRFVLGVDSPAAIGQTGGAESHDLGHKHDFFHRHNGTTNSSNHGACQVWADPNGFCWALDPSHTHSFTTGGPIDEPGGNNLTGSALGEIDNRPPFYALLKLVRIK